jgi:glycosyltransferase involved in cell wall biosynthesis
VRVLIVSTTYPPADISGVGTLVYELGAELERAGYEARVWTRRGGAGDRRARALGGSRLTFPWLAAWRFFAERAWRDLDVLHVHESDGVLVALVARLARFRRSRRPRIAATLQVSYVRERRAVRPVRAVPGGPPVSRPTFGENVFRWLRAPILSLLGRCTARLADVVVAPSHATAGELRDDYGARVVAVIPNGVSLSLHERAGVRGTHSDDDDPRPIVLFVGRLRTRKAAAVLLETMALLRQRGVAARAIVVGDGEQSGPLHRQARRLDLERDGTVAWVGHADREQVATWLERAAIFCLPSTYEGFPLAILEAMAAGLAVVATRISGNPEAVDDGVTGRLVPPEDAEALAQAIAALLGDPEAARGMGEAGRRRLAADFSIGAVTAAYLRLWQDLPP